MGIALMLVSQAILNMMVAVGLFPVTGQPLPLISKGGTSTLINCAYIGMILSVSRYTAYLEEKKKILLLCSPRVKEMRRLQVRHRLRPNLQQKF